MKLDDSVNWRAMIQPGSRLDEAMKAANIHFPPAVTDALQDQYDATYVQLFGKVSKETVKIQCELKNGVPEYECEIPMFENDFISPEKKDPRFPSIPAASNSGYWNARLPALTKIKEEVDAAKQTGLITRNVKVGTGQGTFWVRSGSLEDIMKVAADFYLSKHCPQYAVDYKAIIASGVDERAERTWAQRAQSDSGKGKGGPAK